MVLYFCEGLGNVLIDCSLAYAEFFSWVGTASAAGGTSTQQDSNAEAGTVRYCHMRPRGGILIMVK